MRPTILALASAIGVLAPLLGVAMAAPTGAAVFAQNCAACHQSTGKGIPGAFPALAGDAFVMGDPHRVVLTLLDGRGGMPSFRSDLDDAQIAAAVSYVRSSWGNHAPPATAAEVARMRGSATSEKAGPALQSH